MAASSASIAASRLLHLRNPALHHLTRRHLLHPAAVASSSDLIQRAFSSPNLSDAGSANLFHLENGSIDSPRRRSTNPTDLNSNLPMILQWPFGSSATQIEAAAARKIVPEEEEEEDTDEDFMDDDEDDDDDDDDDDDEIDDVILDRDEDYNTTRRYYM
ncbi:hypothetical protein ABFS83_13G074700 [Erythranthe nasuta]